VGRTAGDRDGSVARLIPYAGLDELVLIDYAKAWTSRLPVPGRTTAVGRAAAAPACRSMSAKTHVSLNASATCGPLARAITKSRHPRRRRATDEAWRGVASCERPLGPPYGGAGGEDRPTGVNSVLTPAQRCQLCH